MCYDLTPTLYDEINNEIGNVAKATYYWEIMKGQKNKIKTYESLRCNIYQNLLRVSLLLYENLPERDRDLKNLGLRDIARVD